MNAPSLQEQQQQPLRLTADVLARLNESWLAKGAAEKHAAAVSASSSCGCASGGSGSGRCGGSRESVGFGAISSSPGCSAIVGGSSTGGTFQQHAGGAAAAQCRSSSGGGGAACVVITLGAEPHRAAAADKQAPAQGVHMAAPHMEYAGD